MGLFWDLVQQSAINTNRQKAESLEERVRDLEMELGRTRKVLAEVIRRLETFTGTDINEDGKIG